MEKNKPVKQFREGAVSASVFKNERKGKDGKPFTAWSIVLQKVYTDKSGKLQNTNSFNKAEINKVLSVSYDAQKYIKEVSQ